MFSTSQERTECFKIIGCTNYLDLCSNLENMQKNMLYKTMNYIYLIIPY